MSEVVQELDEEAMSKLVDFWDGLPAFKTLEENKYVKLLHAPVRSQIINVLSKGIKEGDNKTRRALTASEILDKLTNIHLLDITKSNLYYHLQKLEENGLIQVILTVQSGNILTSYYGRTSKLVYLDAKVKDDIVTKEAEVNLFANPNFLEFMKRLGHVDPLTIEDTLKELEPLVKYYNHEFREWVLKHEIILQGIDLNLMDLHQMYITIKRFKMTSKHLNDLAEWLEIE